MQTQQNIELLPEHVINQIKAGEVIDSPSGIIKELIENSIDSSATHINIDVQNNGLDYINISDNGKGISYAQLPLAFARHATSKIRNFNDVYQLHSFGFRGEALASLSSVSQIKCTTTTQEESSHYHIKGAQEALHQKAEKKLSTTGTNLNISQLFFNTPVRFKFLSHQKKEKSDIVNTIYSQAISHPEVAFTFSINTHEKTILKSSSERERIANILKVKEAELRNIKNSFDKYSTHFYVDENPRHRPLQMIFINNRIVEYKKVRNSINYSLLNLGLSNKFSWVIKINVPTHEVDVNIHPKKTSVKVFKESLILSFISKTINKIRAQSDPLIEKELSETNLVPNIRQNESFTPQSYKGFNSQKSNLEFSPTSESAHDFEVLCFNRNEQFLLLLKEQKVFILKTKDFYNDIYKLLTPENTNQVPLLVSKSINFNKPVQFQDISLALDALSIETMMINESQFIIKSLPKVLSFLEAPDKILQTPLRPEDLIKLFQIKPTQISLLFTHFPVLQNSMIELNKIINEL